MGLYSDTLKHLEHEIENFCKLIQDPSTKTSLEDFNVNIKYKFFSRLHSYITTKTINPELIKKYVIMYHKKLKTDLEYQVYINFHIKSTVKYFNLICENDTKIKTKFKNKITILNELFELLNKPTNIHKENINE